MYVADTHAWLYYLLNRLPHASNKIFSSVENGDGVIFVPAIALSECVHLIGKKKIILTYEDLFSRFDESNNFVVAPLTLEITKIISKIELKELHDRIIVATAKFLNANLITKDKEIIKSEIVKTIWN
jgi:PIN domain nuclease of toxin-antitoxin system